MSNKKGQVKQLIVKTNSCVIFLKYLELSMTKKALPLTGKLNQVDTSRLAGMKMPKQQLDQMVRKGFCSSKS
jgi:hypothetical protein